MIKIIEIEEINLFVPFILKVKKLNLELYHK
jgi:hypothetical protein